VGAIDGLLHVQITDRDPTFSSDPRICKTPLGPFDAGLVKPGDSLKKIGSFVDIFSA